MQRFLIALPTSLIGSRDNNPNVISPEVKESYEANLKKLYDLHAQFNGEKIVLKLSNEAQVYLDTIQTEIEIEMGDLEESSFYREWLGKLVGNIIRIAGLLHVADNISHSSVIPLEISLDTLKKADSVKSYFKSHARYLFNEEFDLTKEIGNKNYILKKAVNLDKESIGKIEHNALWQAVKKKVKPADVFNNYLSSLEKTNYIEVVKEGRKNYIYINPNYKK